MFFNSTVFSLNNLPNELFFEILKNFDVDYKTYLFLTVEMKEKLIKFIKILTTLNCVSKSMNRFKLPQHHNFNQNRSVFLDQYGNGVIPNIVINDDGKICSDLINVNIWENGKFISIMSFYNFSYDIVDMSYYKENISYDSNYLKIRSEIYKKLII